MLGKMGVEVNIWKWSLPGGRGPRDPQANTPVQEIEGRSLQHLFPDSL